MNAGQNDQSNQQGYWGAKESPSDQPSNSQIPSDSNQQVVNGPSEQNSEQNEESGKQGYWGEKESTPSPPSTAQIPSIPTIPNKPDEQSELSGQSYQEPSIPTIPNEPSEQPEINSQPYQEPSIPTIPIDQPSQEPPEVINEKAMPPKPPVFGSQIPSLPPDHPIENQPPTSEETLDSEAYPEPLTPIPTTPTPITEEIYPSPEEEITPADIKQAKEHQKIKLRISKVYLSIFFGAIIIIGGLGYLYYYLTYGGKTAHVQGMEERIVVNIPKGYKKVPESNAVYLYKTKETHLSDVKKEGTTRVFKIAFLSRTKSRSISEEISRIKIEYEGAETKYGNYTLASLVKINGFQAVKKEGRIKIESGEYYLTEYTIPSEKNIFVISRYSPTKQSKWAEADFNKIIGSIEIY